MKNGPNVVRQEVREVISKIDMSESPSRETIVQSIYAMHLDECTTDYACVCVYGYIKQIVYECTSKTKGLRKLSEEDPYQIVLQGMQATYPITRGDDIFLVRPEDCSYDELTKIGEMHIAQSSGHSIAAKQVFKLRDTIYGVQRED